MRHPNPGDSPPLDRSPATASPIRRWRGFLAALAVSLSALSTPAAAKFLEPEQAFRFSAEVADADTIAVTYRIADGYYLYRERFRFALDPATAAGASLGEPRFPKGEIKYDETFEKDVEHYRGQVVVRIPVSGATGAVTLLSTSQGCADAGLCYPPQIAQAILTIGGSGPSTARDARVSAARPPLDDPSRIARTLRDGNVAWIALLFVGLGVLLAFTPCVLPMVPILSSILVGQADAHRPATRMSGFILAAAYSLGLALVYTLLGIGAGLAGEGLAAALQAPWILATFAALLIALSLSMFGLYTLQLPAAMQERLTRWSGRMGRADGRTSLGRLSGIFAMGAVSALIVGPCVAAPLAGTLLYISQTRDVLLGGLALFSLAVGMSVPLLLVGLSASTLLPRVGAWMETVKRFFGILLIAVALWMVMPIVPTWVAMLGWALLAIMAAVELRVLDALGRDASGAARLAKGVGVVLLLAGTVEFVGLATGGRDVLQPLAHLARATKNESPDGSRASTPPFEPVRSVAELDRRLLAATAAGKPVLLDFYADWCVSCKEMERFTYGDAPVATRMQAFVLLKADVTANGDDDRALLRRFQLFGPPGIVFFDRSGLRLDRSDVIGFQDADRFLANLAVVVPERGS